MVRGHRDQGRVVGAVGLHAGDHAPDLTVGERDLELQALAVVLGQRAAAEPDRAVHARERVAERAPRLLARGQEHVRAVRQQHVLEVQRRLAGLDRGEEPVQAVAAPALEQREDVGPLALRALAVARRAHRGRLLGADDPVAAAAEDGVDRLGVAHEVRRGGAARQLAVHDLGDRPGGGVVGGAGVLEPGAAGGQGGEVGVPHGVDLAVGAQHLVHRELVHDDQDDRGLLGLRVLGLLRHGALAVVVDQRDRADAGQGDEDGDEVPGHEQSGHRDTEAYGLYKRITRRSRRGHRCVTTPVARESRAAGLKFAPRKADDGPDDRSPLRGRLVGGGPPGHCAVGPRRTRPGPPGRPGRGPGFPDAGPGGRGARQGRGLRPARDPLGPDPGPGGRAQAGGPARRLPRVRELQRLALLPADLHRPQAALRRPRHPDRPRPRRPRGRRRRGGPDGPGHGRACARGDPVTRRRRGRPAPGARGRRPDHARALLRLPLPLAWRPQPGSGQVLRELPLPAGGRRLPGGLLVRLGPERRDLHGHDALLPSLVLGSLARVGGIHHRPRRQRRERAGPQRGPVLARLLRSHHALVRARGGCLPGEPHRPGARHPVRRGRQQRPHVRAPAGVLRPPHRRDHLPPRAPHPGDHELLGLQRGRLRDEVPEQQQPDRRDRGRPARRRRARPAAVGVGRRPPGRRDPRLLVGGHAVARGPLLLLPRRRRPPRPARATPTAPSAAPAAPT